MDKHHETSLWNRDFYGDHMVQSVGFCRKELWDFMENITYFVNRIGISLIHIDTSFKNIQLMFMGVYGISRYFLGSEVRHILSRKLTFYKKRFHVGSPMLKFISGISIIPPKMATNWDLANKNWGVKHDMYWFNHHELIMVWPRNLVTL